MCHCDPRLGNGYLEIKMKAQTTMMSWTSSKLKTFAQYQESKRTTQRTDEDICRPCVCVRDLHQKHIMTLPMSQLKVNEPNLKMERFE